MAGFISYHIREMIEKDLYSFKYFLKVSDEVNTGSTDFEFVCTICYFTLVIYT